MLSFTKHRRFGNQMGELKRIFHKTNLIYLLDNKNNQNAIDYIKNEENLRRLIGNEGQVKWKPRKRE